MSVRVRGAIAITVVVATALVGYARHDVSRAEAATPLGPGLVTVTVGIRYSKFSIDTLHVRAGTTVLFLVRNDDPINHEFIVGDASVHRRHELGKDRAHPPIPGEVSVPPDDVGETFYTFATPGRFLFACHLPGHFAYGMHGEVVVDPA
jgi:uncharacterized cupredoxin-like copper-binding protein